MFKSIFPILLFLFLMPNLNGQSRFYFFTGLNNSFKSGIPETGIHRKVGSIAPYDFYERFQQSIKYTNKMGFQAGARFEVRCFKNFFLATELGIAYHSNKIDRNYDVFSVQQTTDEVLKIATYKIKDEIKTLNLAVPLILKYEFSKTSPFWLEVGYGILKPFKEYSFENISGQIFYELNAETFDYNPIPSSYSDKYGIGTDSYFAWQTGAGFKLKNQLSILARYRIGKVNSLPTRYHSIELSSIFSLH